MRPFRFPLQRVLDVKTLAEKQQQMRLAEAQREVAAAEAALARTVRIRADAVAGGNSESVVASPLLRTMSWRQRSRLRETLQLDENRLTEERRKLDEQRDELLDRRKERRSLELLRDKKWQQHRDETNRREQNVVDDLFIGRFRLREGEDRHG